MEAKTIDPTEFRDAQRNQWNKAATGWKKWVDEMTATTQPVSDRLVELAGISPGSRALDFPEGSFDATVSRWGIIFEPEAEATAARIRRFLKPGGHMAIASWGTPP